MIFDLSRCFPIWSLRVTGWLCWPNLWPACTMSLISTGRRFVSWISARCLSINSWKSSLADNLCFAGFVILLSPPCSLSMSQIKRHRKMSGRKDMGCVSLKVLAVFILVCPPVCLCWHEPRNPERWGNSVTLFKKHAISNLPRRRKKVT